MKRNYSKPELVFEDFHLTGPLAGCHFDPDAADVSCTASNPEDPDLLVFHRGTAAPCMIDPPEGDSCAFGTYEGMTASFAS